MSLFNSSGFYVAPPAWRDHICGLYYIVPARSYQSKVYLPQVELQAHSTILATTSRTVLTQTFVNPSQQKAIREVRYTFPLYDGVSVVGFTCHIGDRTIVGEVKEKEKAKAVFKEAVERGETAGLLEQLPDAADVFTTTVGNVPPGARVIIKITYLGELKHDMEVDGIRFTIPNVICPRYGAYPGDLHTTDAINASGKGISITVDAEMAEGSFIQRLQSPTHPISMTMGTTSFAPNAEPAMTKASASLTLGTAELEKDFVLQIIAKDTGVPKAVLENHPTIPNHRALMATLVPKFALPGEKPEVVFVCDRSGSMSGSRMNLVKQALKVFLKSLPVGVKFNICSFGSSHAFLWPKSKTYSQQTLDEAIRHAETFDANFGGTEMLYPLKATITQRYKDMPLEIMMLTDGEIWDQQTLFSYLNDAVHGSKSPIRIFTLGIGNGVSHSLIEGIAKAGNGFSQTVGEGEKMDSKVVRMLKGALSPHINDYTLEIKYATKSASENEDDFEIVEKVVDSLKVNLNLDSGKKAEPVGFQSKTMRALFADCNQKKISLFDMSADPDKDEPPAYDETGEAKYAHLPKIAVPKIIQAPQTIPTLFAFNRTTAYLLLGPEAPQSTPKSVILRGTSVHGPLELEIPIQIQEIPGETIHQLAAKKAISELEQGRGWLPEARDETGQLIKTKYEGRFEDMVEREAVRLGVQFQVGGKWCSFVAVESNKRSAEQTEQEANGWDFLEDEKTTVDKSAPPSKYTFGESLDNSDDSEIDEEELDREIDKLQADAKRINQLALSMQEEVEYQNALLSRIQTKSANVDSFCLARGGDRKLARFGDDDCESKSRKTATSAKKKSAPRTDVLQQEIDDTVAVMRENVGRVSMRGERLDSVERSVSRGETLDLQDRTNELTATSKLFYRSAKPQKSSGLFGGLFGSSKSSSLPGSDASLGAPTPSSVASASMNSSGGSWFSGSALFGRASSSSPSTQAFGSAAPPPPGMSKPGFAPQTNSAPAPPGGFGSPSPSNPFADRRSRSSSRPSASFGGAAATAEAEEADDDTTMSDAPAPSPLFKPTHTGGLAAPAESLVHDLIALQSFTGSWPASPTLFALLGLPADLQAKHDQLKDLDPSVFATALVVAVFEARLGAWRGSWELVVEKARGWLEERGVDVEGVVGAVGKVL